MIHDQRQLINKTRQLAAPQRSPAQQSFMFDFLSKPTSVLPPTKSPGALIKRETFADCLGRHTQMYVSLSEAA